MSYRSQVERFGCETRGQAFSSKRRIGSGEISKRLADPCLAIDQEWQWLRFTTTVRQVVENELLDVGKHIDEVESVLR